MRLLVFLLFALFQTISAAEDSFVGSFDLISIQKYKNGNVRYDTLNYEFFEDTTIITVQAKGNQPDIKMIFDFKDSTISTSFKINGRDGGYTLPMDLEHWPGMISSGTKDRNAIDKTAESKEIENYTTYKQTAISDDYEAELWVTDEHNLSMLQILSYQSVGKGKSKKELEMFNKFELYNLPLLMMLKSKKGKADVEIKLINFTSKN